MYHLIEQLYTVTFVTPFALYSYVKIRRAIKDRWISKKYEQLMNKVNWEEDQMRDNYNLAYAHYCNRRFAWGTENESKYGRLSNNLLFVAMLTFLISFAIPKNSCASITPESQTNVERESHQ